MRETLFGKSALLWEEEAELLTSAKKVKHNSNALSSGNPFPIQTLLGNEFGKYDQDTVEEDRNNSDLGAAPMEEEEQQTTDLSKIYLS